MAVALHALTRAECLQRATETRPTFEYWPDAPLMNGHLLNVVNLVNFGCWILCFWWMHRISGRQNAVLDELAQQTRRIEAIAKEEHAILTDLHPKAEAIQHGVEQVSEKVRRVEGGIRTKIGTS